MTRLEKPGEQLSDKADYKFVRVGNVYEVDGEEVSHTELAWRLGVGPGGLPNDAGLTTRDGQTLIWWSDSSYYGPLGIPTGAERKQTVRKAEIAFPQFRHLID